MQTFTGLSYIKIAIANHHGEDKLTWDERIAWVDDNIGYISTYLATADEPLLMEKAINALLDAMGGTPTGYIMGLDATASGLQVMACLTGCKKTAEAVNLIKTGKREDVYLKTSVSMSKLTSTDFDRKVIKKPLMTYFYGSTAEPRACFGEGTTLDAFYEAMEKELPGACAAMGAIQSCWQSDALAHQWHLPDGHLARVKVMDTVQKKIEVGELDGATFTYQANVNQASDWGVSLAANIIHSIDGYIVREMTRRAYKQGWEILSIHDCFWCSPNHMNELRQNFIDILVGIAESNLLQDILNEITGNEDGVIEKLSDDLGEYIKDAEYPLS